MFLWVKRLSQDTSAEFSRLERRTPHHFVLPFFDVNIGHAIKNQAMMFRDFHQGLLHGTNQRNSALVEDVMCLEQCCPQGSMNHMQSYQMQVMLRPGDVAIDVGANLGCYTVALAEAFGDETGSTARTFLIATLPPLFSESQAVGPRGHVIAFEPFRWLHQLVVANVAINGTMTDINLGV